MASSIIWGSTTRWRRPERDPPFLPASFVLKAAWVDHLARVATRVGAGAGKSVPIGSSRHRRWPAMLVVYGPSAAGRLGHWRTLRSGEEARDGTTPERPDPRAAI